MSEIETPQIETTKSSTNPIIIVLVVVVVVLAAGLVYMVWNSNNSDVVSTSPAGQTPVMPPANTGTNMGTTGGTPAPAANFDPATATKVPAGTTPEDFVKLYHEDVIAGKYAEAYKMLPLDKQQSYGDAASYEEQVKAYGITSYELGSPAANGDDLSIAATQVTPQMPITYTWSFKKVGDVWYVTARNMGGSTN